MSVYFCECPDCKSMVEVKLEREQGHYQQVIKPEYDYTADYQSDAVRILEHSIQEPIEVVYINGKVRAICSVCGWSTNRHNTVQECSDEWCSAKVIPGGSS